MEGVIANYYNLVNSTKDINQSSKLLGFAEYDIEKLASQAESYDIDFKELLKLD